MVTLQQLIINSARSGLSLQNEDGSMPAGHNGPWMDIDTPVRNTAHWLITFLHAWEFTDEYEFKTGAELALNYLCDRKVRPYNSAFICRLGSGKNSCNGLIGQAWALEALVTAAAKLKQKDYLDLAKSIYLMHHFSINSGLWSVIDIDGKDLGRMETINQQIWFAAIGAKILELQFDKVIDLQIRTFMKNILSYLIIDKEGCIQHRFAAPKSNVATHMRSFRRNLIRLTKDNADGTDKNSAEGQYLKMLSIGYHSFTLFGLALLVNSFPDAGIKKSDKIRGALNYISSSNYHTEILKNPYCFGYNPTGIELAHVIGEFADNREEVFRIQQNWLNKQFKETFNFKAYLMNRYTSDPQTLAARLYECTSLIEQDDRWKSILIHI
jgi:hypothetical protein